MKKWDNFRENRSLAIDKYINLKQTQKFVQQMLFNLFVRKWFKTLESSIINKKKEMQYEYNRMWIVMLINIKFKKNLRRRGSSVTAVNKKRLRDIFSVIPNLVTENIKERSMDTLREFLPYVLKG